MLISECDLNVKINHCSIDLCSQSC